MSHPWSDDYNLKDFFHLLKASICWKSKKKTTDWKMKSQWANLNNGFFCRLLSSSSCAGSQSGSGFHDWGGHLWLHCSGSWLSCHRGRHFTNESDIPFYHYVGIILGSHVQDFQTIVVESRKLTLKWMTSLLASNFYRCLAIEDCELTPCENNITYMQKMLIVNTTLLKRMILTDYGVEDESNKV